MRKNIFLYITAFFSGMSIMAVELSASRLLAPYFGTSSIVWTVIIGIIMISLSVGNMIGGRKADRHNNGDRLYSLIWLASILIAVIPLIGKYIIVASTPVLMWIASSNLIIAGSVVSCILIFSFPLIILGMVSPFLVKLSVKDMENNGRTTGDLYGLSTIGSIIGTFIPTFLTIPVIGTSKTFFVFALILNLICLYYFITTKKRIIRTAVSTAVITVLLFAPLNDSYAFWEKNVLYEGESLYNYLQVKKGSDSVILSTNVAFGVQSIFRKDHILSGYYYDYALMAPLFMKDMSFDRKLDVLILGLGTGTFAKECRYFFPNTTTDGVEIDQKIVDLSKKYFDLKDEEANIFVNDGRTFLSSKDAKKYDLIMLDAYHDITIPFHMSTKEFFSEVKNHLNPNGVIMMNINMRSEKNTEITDYLTQTLKYSMKKVYKYDIQYGTNTIVVSSDDEKCRDNYVENINKIGESHPLYKLSRYVDKSMKEVTDSKCVLTDEIAPVEIMGQKVLDEMVNDSLVSLKDSIKSSKNGIWDLLNMISGG